MDLESESRTLYVGNLDKNVTEEILYELFLQAGPVERVSIPINNNESFRYGFVTYKHDVSIDYALRLYKGTSLFKKELSIKKKGPRNSSNDQHSNNDFNKYGGTINSNQTGLKSIFEAFTTNQWEDCLLSQAKNASQFLINFASSSLKGNWSSRNKPYRHDPRNHTSRSRESRGRYKEKDYGNKFYTGRKNRQR